jgi:hypothetical protein
MTLGRFKRDSTTGERVGVNAALLINSYDPISSGPFEGLFFCGSLKTPVDGCCLRGAARRPFSSAQTWPRSRGLFFYRKGRFMPKCRLDDCLNTVTGRQTYCTDRCRQRARKGSKALRYRRGQNRQISASHAIEPIKEFQPTSGKPNYRRPVIDRVGTDRLSELVATETTRLKPVPASAYKHLKLEQVNAITWKVVDPDIKTDVPAKLGHWAGYRTTKPLAWVIDLGHGQWTARCGNEVCNPTNLAEAKRQALAMAVGAIGDYRVSDPVRELQELSALIEDRRAA